ncbi:MAG TPA: redoxin domain-containing protein [Candidatus Acidoferrales bacterium]|jgi:peroxiredoxin|nr:redoxin domain-containing protein [Candidatus Acidoferrales bacterium]
MKKLSVSLAVMALAASAFAVEVGKPAPNFTATDINGKTVQLSDYAGKIVVIESYNSDCPFCHNQYSTGAMQDLQKDLAAKGVVWLLVNSVNPNNSSHRTDAQAKAEMASENMDVTAWIDDSSGKVGHLYGMLTTPHMFVIDKSGTLVYDGAIDNQPDPSHNPKNADNYVKDAVDDLQAGKPIAVSQTKPYGCGVKYAD